MTTKPKTEATGLDLLRKPFLATQISKLPKVTCGDCTRKVCSQHKKTKCSKCGAYITTAHVDLDFVGHAALTDRLLDADPEWAWEPLAFDERGLPAYDSINGLWIKLTICGITRLGYGDAQGKSGNNAVKEIIGDALRNAAMRFGAALDLWHKGDLHADEETLAGAEHKQLVDKTLSDDKKAGRRNQGTEPADDPWAKPVETDQEWITGWVTRLAEAKDKDALQVLWGEMVEKHKNLQCSDTDRADLTDTFKNAAALLADEPAA